MPNVEKPNGQSWKLATSFHGLVFLFSLLIIGLSVFMRMNDSDVVYWPGSIIPMPETCLTKQFIGMDCPGCGMTRAFISLGHGDPQKAVQLNASSLIVYAFFAIQIPWHAMQLWLIHTGKGPVDRWWTVLPVLIVIATMLGCWCWKYFA